MPTHLLGRSGFYSKLKGPDGEWINTEVQSMHGQSTGLFLGLDRSGKTARREFQAKRLAQFCKAQGAAKRWRSDRQQGIVYCNSMPVLSFVVGSRAHPFAFQLQRLPSARPQPRGDPRAVRAILPDLA
eukprot:1925464-Pyramimonas_sp.AAC.1